MQRSPGPEPFIDLEDGVFVGLRTGCFAFGQEGVPFFGQPLVTQHFLGNLSFGPLVEYPHAFQDLVYLVVDVETGTYEVLKGHRYLLSAASEGLHDIGMTGTGLFIRRWQQTSAWSIYCDGCPCNCRSKATPHWSLYFSCCKSNSQSKVIWDERALP